VPTNPHGQPIGPALLGWTPRPLPPATPMVGRFCRLEPLDVDRHAGGLYAALKGATADWTYLPNLPPETFDAYRERLGPMAHSRDPLFYTIVDGASGDPCGIAAFLRIDAGNGVIEVGHIHYGARLQRTPAGTEAMALMMTRAFDELGYRRYEWKCDTLNAPSRAAAQRYGFTFEGVFRQAIVTKDRSRDTAWYSILDSEWPALKAAFAAWLAPENFDSEGQQRISLTDARRP
jgi:RimJ/RimL family protein N-acetyltransferase